MIETLTGEAHRPGRIEVVCGSMFSGKTEELIRRLKRAKFARQRVIIFKPVIDTRYSDTNVVSHDHNAIPSTPVQDSEDVLQNAAGYDVIGIDEAQFFDEGLVDVCNKLAYRGMRVVVAGLDMDFKGIPFGPMPALCAVADEVTKNDSQVMLGEKMEYEPLCRECYRKAIAEDERNARSKNLFENE